MKKIFTCCLAIALAHTTLMSGAARAQDAKSVQTAVVTDVQGEVFAVPERRLVLLSAVGAGEKIRLKGASKVTLFFPSKSIAYAIAGEGEFSVTDTEVAAMGSAAKPVRRELAPAYKNVRLRADSLAQAGIVLRSALRDNGEFSPANEKISCVDVAFRWPAFGRGQYALTVTDEMDTPIHRATVSITDYRLPETAKLLAGARYRWTVSALKAQGKAIQKWAEFSCLTTDELHQIAALHPAENATLSDYVTYALFLESANTNSLAKAAWQEIAVRFPSIELEAGISR